MLSSHANDSILRIVGSSTAYPFITAVAENFNRSNRDINVVVENTGTGTGFKLFCSSQQEKFPELIVASRKIRESEIKQCNENGIFTPLEIIFGYDGIIFASSKKNKINNLNRNEIFLALSKKIHQKGQFIDNSYSNWQQISSLLPNTPIKLYGPAPSSGTREEIEQLIMNYACKKLPRYLHNRYSRCTDIRRDGTFIEIGRNENLIIQKIINDDFSIGIIGYNYYMQNTKIINAIEIDNFFPDNDNLMNMKYPLTRPLYIYARSYNSEHDNQIILKFLQGLITPFMVGYNGYLHSNGLIPLTNKEISKTQIEINKFFKKNV
jgi:phosphate transport system substrate-binding protein